MKVNCKHEGQLQSFKREQFSIFTTQYVDSVFTRYVDYADALAVTRTSSHDRRATQDTLRRLPQSIYADFGRRISHNHSW